MTTPEPWRLLQDEPRDGAWNMAADESLLRSMDALLAAGENAAPILRLYSWRPAAVSTGRAQKLPAACDLAACEAEGVDVVRRPTGGRGVLHDIELTFAVIAPCSGRFAGDGVTQASAALAGALVRGLRALGVDASSDKGAPPMSPRAGRGACFASTARAEVVAGGRKLCGSAQFRGQQAFLQHGSLPLVFDVARQARLLGADAELLARKACGLSDVLSAVPSLDDVRHALASGFAAEFDAQLVPGAMSLSESSRFDDHLALLRSDSERWHAASPREASVRA